MQSLFVQFPFVDLLFILLPPIFPVILWEFPCDSNPELFFLCKHILQELFRRGYVGWNLLDVDVYIECPSFQMLKKRCGLGFAFFHTWNFVYG